MSDDLVADAMLPSHERLVEIHRRLDPPGTSLLSVEQLVSNLQDVYEATKEREALACRQADELQSDLERRGAALGRALALMNQLWRQLGSRNPHTTPPWIAAPGATWPDVLRWVTDEPKKEGENVSDPAAADAHADGMVEHYAGSLSDVDWRSAEESRWSAFSDEELQALAEMTSLCSTSEPLASARRAMAQEVAIVRAWREAEQPTYRGPGRYLSIVGPTYEVLGVLGDLVIVRDPTRAPGALVSVTRRSFEARGEGGKRLYEYLGPLEGS